MLEKELYKRAIESAKCRVYRVINNSMGSSVAHQRKAENQAEIQVFTIQALEQIQHYRAIGTVEECREAVEKQKAKKPVQGRAFEWIDTVRERGRYINVKRMSYHDACPNCGGTVTRLSNKYCDDCGTAIDWSVE